MSPASRQKVKRRPATRKGPAAAQASARAGLSPSELERLAQQVIRLSDADETEVLLEATRDALTRFANNTIHQNVAEQMIVVSVRTVYDGQTARATTNKTDEESLRRVVAASASLARCQPKNLDLLPMPGRQKIRPVERFYPATAAAAPEDRARAVRRVVELAARRGQTAAGIFSTGASQVALANSRGLFAHYEQTRGEFSVTFLETDSSGWAKANFPDIARVEPDALAERASEKAAAARAPREIAPGRYTTILEPAAVLDLVGFLFYDFAATAVLDKRSCLTDRLGQQLFGPNITIWDDVYHPLQTGMPFDGEGVPREKVLLVERGVARNLVYARATAKKMNAKPTGHGFTLPNEYGEAPVNLVFAGGDESIDRMVATTERGILVTRLWYIREVDPYQKILTGMTRDGTFLIENGKLAGGIRNFRFNQSVIEMLSSVEALGPGVRAAGEESFEMVVPAMKVAGFHFTEATKF